MEPLPGRKRRQPSGGGLKLETFANAKASKYNIKELKRKHKFIENAQKVRKFRKQLRKDEASQPERIAEGAPDQAVLPEDTATPSEHQPEKEPRHRDSVTQDDRSGGSPRRHKRRKLSQVERLKREADAERAAHEAEQLERRKETERQREQKEAAARARKETFAKMHKKTRRGQPVMKHRMEHLLEKLQKNST